MKLTLNRLLFLSMCMTFIVFLSACGPTKVTPPEDMTGSDNGNGGDLNYPANQSNSGFSEDNLPAEGTLDDNTTVGKNGYPGGIDPDSQSAEYKMEHGRCTPGFSPLYFDFDQARLSSDMMAVADQNAAFLQQNPSMHVRLEGNSDQRGTNEYNMALSERRAVNVRNYLENLGIDANRIRTIAYGEERPLFPGTTEEDYKYNRRVDFIAE